ncbi:MAG TPA: hypothetical protein VNZ64_24235 [Candidatus Acidoferrum sp.]|jgi:hypothetical protein|nr:hypothetical protein [Candidatus Acidoferrum sp.]
MATDPERPIEKLLRACADKRREEAGAPLELHPATRRLLQDEAARRYAKPALQPGPIGVWLSHLWPRLALGVAGVAAVAAIVLVVIRPRPQTPEQLAKNELFLKREPAEARRIPPPTEPAAPAAQATAPAGSLASTEPRMEPLKQMAAPTESSRRQEPLPALNAPGASGAVPMPKASVNSASAEALAARDFDKTSDSAMQAAPSVPDQRFAARYGLRAPPQPEVAQVAKDAPANQRFDFVQVDARAKAQMTDRVASATPVLSSFQVEQSGSVLQIIDNDGSVYSGYLQPAERATASVSAKAQGPATASALRLAEKKGALTATAPAPASASTGSNYFFRVVGTNQTLNQRVVFSGNLVCPGNFPSSASTTGVITGGVVGRAFFDSGATGALPLHNAHISGKALLDDRRAIEIDALSAKQ